MRVAFKEWAVVVDALASGRQIIILRKGGISEGRRGFQVEHAEFLLWPTLVHQQKESILPIAYEYFDRLISPSTDSAQIRLQYFAHVVSWRRIDALKTVEQLRGQHIWRDEVIAERFDWGKEKNIYALAVRVFRLTEEVMIPNLPVYSGCKSWIDLDTDVSSEGATPVLSKEDFNEKLNLFHAALDSDSTTPEPSPPS